MPEEKTIKRARKDKREGKAPSTQAGEFVREEFHHVREGKHVDRSPRQAIAIGLSKARRAGVKLPPPSRGRFSAKVRRQAERDYEKGQRGNGKPSPKRSRAVKGALKRERRSSANRSAAAREAALTRSRSRFSTGASRARRPPGRSHSRLSATTLKLARQWRSRF